MDSLSGFSFGWLVVVVVVILFLGFSPLLSFLQFFASGTNTLLSVLGALFFVCKLEGGTSKI